MKITRDTKVIAFTAIASIAVLFAAASKSLNAGQQRYDGYRNYGYDVGYERPTQPGYRYYTSPDQLAMQGYIHPAPDSSSAYPPAQTAKSTSAPNTVMIAGMQFQPATIRVKAGEDVTWTNYAPMIHTITSHHDGSLASERLGQGSMFTHTFKQPGIYIYYCALHRSMNGRVIVE